MTTNQRGGARPATRDDDGRRHNRAGPGSGRKDGYRIIATLGETQFIYDVRQKRDAEAIKGFAELIGCQVSIEKIKMNAIIL